MIFFSGLGYEKITGSPNYYTSRFTFRLLHCFEHLSSRCNVGLFNKLNMIVSISMNYGYKRYITAHFFRKKNLNHI